MKIVPVLRTLALAALALVALFALGSAYGAALPIGLCLAATVIVTPVTAKLGVSAYTQIADLWVPARWQQGQMEMQVNTPNIFRSALVVSSDQTKQLVNGDGMESNLPFIIEPRPAAQQQRERVAPDITKLSSGLQKATVVHRVSPLGSTALAKAISGADPVAAILAVIDNIRTAQFQTALVSQLTGIFGLNGTPNQAVGPFRALRYDKFLEDGGTPLEANLITSETMLLGTALMGQAIEKLEGGTVFAHTDIVTSLQNQDQIDFVRNSEGKFLFRAWKGLRVVVDDSLKRAGATTGSVYSTLVCAPGSIIFDQKPQVFTDKPGEVAAVQLDLTQISTNDVVIYDRTRYCLHPQGAKWVGTPTYADAGPSDAEFAVTTNWNLALNDVRNSGIVAIRTNG